jgi:hypothetical protein
MSKTAKSKFLFLTEEGKCWDLLKQQNNSMLFSICYVYFVLDKINEYEIRGSKLLRISTLLKADSHIACRAHSVPLPCLTAKVLEYVFPIWFTQCGRVWFTLAMPHPCHALTMPFFSRPRHSTAVRPCCGVALRRTAWSERGMGAAWQVWIRHGRTV